MIKQSDEPIGLTCGLRARKTKFVVARSRMRVHSKRHNVCLLALSGRYRVLVPTTVPIQEQKFGCRELSKLRHLVAILPLRPTRAQ